MEYRRLRDIVVEDLDGDSALCDSLECCSAKGRTVIFNNKDTDIGILYDLLADQYNKELQQYIDHKELAYEKKYKLSIERYEAIRKGLAVIYKSLPGLREVTIEQKHFKFIIYTVTSIMYQRWGELITLLSQEIYSYPETIKKFLEALSRNAIDIYCSDTGDNVYRINTGDNELFAGCEIDFYENLFCKAMAKSVLDALRLPFSAAFIARILEMTNAKIFEYVEKNDVSREAIK